MLLKEKLFLKKGSPWSCFSLTDFPPLELLIPTPFGLTLRKTTEISKYPCLPSPSELIPTLIFCRALPARITPSPSVSTKVQTLLYSWRISTPRSPAHSCQTSSLSTLEALITPASVRRPSTLSSKVENSS